MMLAGAAPWSWAQEDAPRPAIEIVAGPKWGEVPPGSWAPYSVTIRNNGQSEINGEVILIAKPAPPPKPGAPPTTIATASTSPTTVVAIGGRSITAPLPQSAEVTSSKPPWPTFRAPVSVFPGTEKALTLVVLQAEFGFDVELVATGGRVLAQTEVAAPAPAPKEQFTVLLLSGVPGAQTSLATLPQLITNGISVVQVRAARDFPDVALHLAGVGAILIDDFDTATLSDDQRRALQEYLSLGGSLIVTGGAAWKRVLGSLPAGIAPLRASGSTPAPLAPLADLVATTSTLTAEVATGEVAADDPVVLAAPGGSPLILESHFGLGKVVQLTFDPLAEPLASDRALQAVAWDSAVSRVADRWGHSTGDVPVSVGEDQVWASALERQQWPSWPRGSIAVLAVFSLLVGPAAFALSRRTRALIAWALMPVVVVVAAGACLVLADSRRTSSESAVEVRTLGADGAVLNTTYRSVLDLDPPHIIEAPSGGASTVFTGRPLFRLVTGTFDPLRQFGPPEPISRGLGGGSVLAVTGRPHVHLPVRPWQLRTVQTVSVEHDGPRLEANLRLVGASKTSAGRVQGTVTNRGPKPVYALRAQLREGQARVSEVLNPGEMTTVDAPIVTANRSVAGPSLLASSSEEMALFAAAGRSFTLPGQIAVVALDSPPVGADAASSRGAADHRIGVIVAAVPLEAADAVLYGSGGGRTVAASPGPQRSVNVIDMKTPPGVGPWTLNYQASYEQPGVPAPPEMFPYAQTYNWVTGTWRTLPPRGERNSSFVLTPIEPAEVKNGLVRFRSQTAAGSFLSSAQLVVTSRTTG